MNLEISEVNRISEKLKCHSFYFLDLEKLKSNFIAFRSAFSEHYGNLEIAYSYKTNYTPAICKTVDELGAIAEVVSKLEYDIAKKIKVKSKIIFNGPVKEEIHIEEVLNDGNIVNIDSQYEVDFLSKISSRSTKSFKIGIRCYFDINSGIKSRFGVNTENDDLEKILARINDLKNFNVNGLHCHFSTKTRDLNSFKTRTEKIISVSKRMFSGGGLEYIDIGGGFFSQPSEEVLRRFPDLKIPNFEQYGEVVGKLMKEAYPNENVTLILEPGTAIVADVLSFFTRVVEVKKLGERIIAQVDGSVQNIKPTGNVNNMMFQLLTREELIPNDAICDVVGNTCMENDILFEGYEGRPGIGDFLRYDNVGAYTLVFKPPFIHGQSPIITREENGEIRIIKKRETADSFLIDYIY